MVSIINCLEKYLDCSAEKSRFVPTKTNIKALFKINDILKKDKAQLLLISEFLIFFTTISSRVDYYLEKLEEADDTNLVNYYCAISDKYLTNTRNDESIGNYPTNKLLFEGDRRSSTSFRNTDNNKYLKKCEELEKEKVVLSKNISECEKENQKLKDKISAMEVTFSDLDSKYKDLLREAELLKNTNKSNIKVQEELLQESIQITQLKNLYSQKEIEMEDMKKDYELQIKSYKEKVASLDEKIENLEDRISSFKSLSTENDKLKSKIKELNLLKEKQNENDDLVLNLESKTRMIDTLIKDKQVYINQIEKLNKDILNEKEKTRTTEFERKRLEFELNDLRKENSRMENMLKNKENQYQNYNVLSDMKRNSVNNSEINYAGKDQGNYLFELDQSSVLYEIDKTKEERIKLLEKEIEELKKEKYDLVCNYKIQNEEINKILSDKEKTSSQLDSLGLELKKVSNERDKLSLEKEKLLLKIQKIELDIQKNDINVGNEKKKLADDLKEAQENNKKLEKQKNSLLKEIDSVKKENTEIIDKLNKEKQILQKEVDRIKATYEKENKNKPKQSLTSNNNTNNTANTITTATINLNNNNSNTTYNSNVSKEYSSNIEDNLEMQNLKVNPYINQYNL